MISHHPSSDMLLEFSEASISTATGVAVSAHLSFCQQCKNKVTDMEAALAENLLDVKLSIEEPGSDELDLDSMLSVVTSTAPVDTAKTEPARNREIIVGELSIEIPLVLGKLAKNIKQWKRYRNGISLVHVRVDNVTQCDFLYMKPGSKVPMHTHGGNEITLVLDGQFRDEDGDYEVGDFLVRDTNVTHATKSQEGCLCFTVLEQPVIFKKGPARLLNLWNKLSFPSGHTHL